MISIFSSPLKNNISRRNAIRSWLSLRVDQQVILSGNREIAIETGAFYVEDNPLEYGKYSIFLFMNPEVIIFDSLVAAIHIVAETFTDGYLVIGGVTKLKTEELNFENEMWDLDLIRDARNHGEECNGRGYFAFPKGLYHDPTNNSGRWLINHAKSLRLPVIDITQYAPAVFQGTVISHKLLDLSSHILTERGIIELRR